MSVAGQTIVVGVDGTESGNQAVRWAARVAVRRRLKLLIVHALRIEQLAYSGGLADASSLFDALATDGAKMLDESVRVAREVAPAVTVETSMPVDSPVANLIDLSSTARMVVVGAADCEAPTGLLIGSTSSAVLAHAEGAVVVIRGRLGTSYHPGTGPVVVGIDGSPVSQGVLESAFEEASSRNTPLVAVHSWNDGASGMSRHPAEWETAESGEQRVLAMRLAGWQEEYTDVEIQRVLVHDRPRQVLLDWSAKAQLLVVGSRGRGGFTGMVLGSTCQALAHHAECPVLVVRPRPRQ